MNKIVSLHVKIYEHQMARLDELAQSHGCNRSEIAREIFDNVRTVNRPVLGSVIGGIQVTRGADHALQVDEIESLI